MPIRAVIASTNEHVVFGFLVSAGVVVFGVERGGKVRKGELGAVVVGVVVMMGAHTGQK